MQLMNVVRGGTLWQDLQAQRAADGHQQPGPKDQPFHEVKVHAGSRLQGLVGEARLAVNSTHHQAVKDLGRGLVASAAADDGVLEGLEDPSHPFFVGVQWHPESMFDAPHRAIYRGLVRAAHGRMGS